MAATDRIQVFKTLDGSRFWTNVYHVNALTLDAAVAFANTILAPTEAEHLFDSFRVVKTLVHHLGTDEFVSTPLNIAGAFTGSPYLPLFNTAKVSISVTGFGRPDFKFYRGGIAEGSQTDGQLEDAVVDAFEAMVNSMISDGTASACDLVDTDGNAWQVASCQKAVQERQLHRRRRRVVTP